MPYEILRCIISLQPKYTKEVTHTATLLYDDKHIIGKLYRYFYFSAFSVTTAESLFLLMLLILTMESADSIRSLYRHFLSGISFKFLNAFYYACSYAKIDHATFLNVTAKLARDLIPGSLMFQPVFLCIDDTMVKQWL